MNVSFRHAWFVSSPTIRREHRSIFAARRSLILSDPGPREFNLTEALDRGDSLGAGVTRGNQADTTEMRRSGFTLEVPKVSYNLAVLKLSHGLESSDENASGHWWPLALPESSDRRCSRSKRLN